MKDGSTNAIAQDLGILFPAGNVGGEADGELLGRFAEGRDAGAFEAIVRRHGPIVWGVCRRVLRDGHDADDAFQATFLVLARRAGTVRPREKLGNWLHGVALRTARKAGAARAKRRAREVQVEAIPEPAVPPAARRHEWSERLDRELGRLPEKYRVAIVLCDLKGDSRREAANRLGLRGIGDRANGLVPQSSRFRTTAP